MHLLRRLEHKLGPYAVPHVTIAIIALQVLVFVVIQIQPNAQKEAEALERLLLIPRLVLEGEWWRLLTFIAVPPVVGKSMMGPIWAFFAWYVFYLMGSALEQFWGTLRYNLYLLVGYVATVAAAFAVPDSIATNTFYLQSVFLAFAFLFPDFQFLLFFILPVKVKWLALLAWIMYAFMFLGGDWMTRLMVLAAISNFLLFFWRDIIERMAHGKRRMARQAAHFAASKPPEFRHRCTVCGVTDKTNPEEDFRYCSKCAGQYAYCSKHLRDHEHIEEAIVD
ncbi:MAG: rhomboid family intramembrane serine protease [Planctomycetota bacterium]|nr:hypothetical protein [Planctomycetaceae bacterium]MDQ3329384.1 rhomboid family intramembrane serine protease [Planctomycetota bacterium]